MKTRVLLCLSFLLLAQGWTHAEPLLATAVPEIARTNENTLNDLFKKIPVLTPIYDKPLRRLSAVQEQLYLYELRMRGEGLPADLAVLFSRNYSSILRALVEDRICEERGRELLSIHRQLVEHTHEWLGKRVRNENYPNELVLNLNYFQTELDESALPLEAISTELRTPVINGYQAWVGELLAWGETCGELSAGDLNRIRVKANELERFECQYKSDGVLQEYERELLHGRFLHLTKETIEVVSR